MAGAGRPGTGNGGPARGAAAVLRRVAGGGSPPKERGARRRVSPRTGIAPEGGDDRDRLSAGGRARYRPAPGLFRSVAAGGGGDERPSPARHVPLFFPGAA